jgi:hypothetical protein
MFDLIPPFYSNRADTAVRRCHDIPMVRRAIAKSASISKFIGIEEISSSLLRKFREFLQSDDHRPALHVSWLLDLQTGPTSPHHRDPAFFT